MGKETDAEDWAWKNDSTKPREGGRLYCDICDIAKQKSLIILTGGEYKKKTDDKQKYMKWEIFAQNVRRDEVRKMEIKKVEYDDGMSCN